MSLISMLGCEIDSVNISPVKVSWELTLWNILSRTVFLILSGFIPSGGEVLLLSKRRSFGLLGSLGGSLSKGKFVVLLAMWPIISMMLLEFTSIGFPGKIKVINCLNHKIVVVGRNVSMMSVVSSVTFPLESVSLWSDGGANHKVGVISWSVSFSGNSLGCLSVSLDILSASFNGVYILLCSCLSDISFWSIDLSNFSLCDLDFTAWQSMISFCLISIEALSSMIFHCASISTCLLNETNHCFTALWIETSIISCSKALCEMIITFSNGINAKISLNIISKIGNKSCSIVQLNSHGLIVNRWPCSVDCSSSVFGSDGFIAILEIKAPGFRLSELKFVIWVLDLYFIWDFVCAEFLSFEKVDFFNCCWDDEFPLTQYVLF